MCVVRGNEPITLRLAQWDGLVMDLPPLIVIRLVLVMLIGAGRLDAVGCWAIAGEIATRRRMLARGGIGASEV
jgi:hypothetical protein